MDEPDESRESAPPSRRLSKTPSWIMLGFLLGAMFVWSLPRPKEAPAVAAAPVKAEAPPAPSAPRLTAVEAVFEEWGQYAVWDNDVTEVALWNPQANAFTDYFEVLRTGDRLYFRSIPRLTRPVLTRGVKENAPMLFTESAAHREEWLRQVREENIRAFSDAARETFNPAHPPPPVSQPAPQTGPAAGKP
ncbi:MAG TPA: hypothetical protein VG838_03740 [Opitutaceae bacterium]|nr:hypothetical protein [Opitutaceae bacterium]